MRVAYERRNRDLDPQLVWRGKDEQDWSDLVVQAPPLYIQEKVHPKVLIDDLLRQSKKSPSDEDEQQIDLFADFNGHAEGRRQDRVLPARPELVEPDDPRRLAAGDGEPGRARGAARQGAVHLHRPALRDQVQQQLPVVTTSRDVKDGNAGHITREPEQVKAFRDTWRDGIHSYLTYLRDRLTVARDLLTESGSIFVQIGDENVHRVRALMDEVFGDDNFVSTISSRRHRRNIGPRTVAVGLRLHPLVCARTRSLKFRQLFTTKRRLEAGCLQYRRSKSTFGDRHRSRDESCRRQRRRHGPSNRQPSSSAQRRRGVDRSTGSSSRGRISTRKPALWKRTFGLRDGNRL